MKKAIYISLAIIISLIMTSSGIAGLNDFSGNWNNTDPDTRGITRLKIRVNGNNVKVRAWGQCHPQDCDWGNVNARAYAPSVSSNLRSSARWISAVFTTNFSRTLVIIKQNSRSKIEAEIFTSFKDGSGRSSYRSKYQFRRAATASPTPSPSPSPAPAPSPSPSPAPTQGEDCISFNPDTARVVKKQGRWKIADGDHWLFDFKGNRSEARNTLRIIKFYGMDQSCFVGRPGPSFNYMLVSGSPPSGKFQREDCISFNPRQLRVKKVNNSYKIVDGSHWLFDFGNKRSEARRALSIIKKYGFRYSCFVGRPDPSFKYMRK